MRVRRLGFGGVLVAIALTSPLALADEPPAEAPEAPPPTVAIDTSDPVCKESSIHCEQTDAPPTIVITPQMKQLGPLLRELRRCLDRDGLPDVASSVRIKWGSNTFVSKLEVSKGHETHHCVTAAKAKLGNLQSDSAVALSCQYECTGGRLVPGPAAPVTPPPKPPPTTPVQDKPLTEMAGPELPSSSSSDSRWYGWQTLLADAASGGMLAIGLGSWTVESTVIGYSGFLLATPIIHAAHGNYVRALASFGLRLLVPAVAGAIGAALNVAANGEETTAKGVVTSAGIGVGLAAGACIVIDLSLFAWKSEERRTGKGPIQLGGSY